MNSLCYFSSKMKLLLLSDYNPKSCCHFSIVFNIVRNKLNTQTVGRLGSSRQSLVTQECRLVFLPAPVLYSTWAELWTQGGCGGILQWDAGDVTGHAIASPGLSSLTADCSASP